MTTTTEHPAPGQTGQPNNPKPFVLGTLNAEELQEYVTDWIEGALGYGADSADALKHHVEMVAHEGPTGWHGESQITSVQLCMMDTTLSCDSTDKLFGAFAHEFIFPNVNWQRACKDAMKRIGDDRAEYRAQREARDQARDDRIRDEAQAEDESTDEPESIPSVGEQFQVSDHCIVSVTLIRDAVMELQARLEGTVPGGNEHLHTRALEDRKPWTDPMNQLSNLNSDLLELLRYLCEQRESIHAEVVTD